MNIVALIGCRVEIKMKKIQEELIQQYRKSLNEKFNQKWNLRMYRSKNL